MGAREDNSRRRPTRLSFGFQWGMTFCLLLSFVSGIVVWRGQAIQLQEMRPVEWIHPWLVVHGWLNPILCGCFGYLLCRHIPGGWKMKVNRFSGTLVVIVFGGLILSGAALYYLGSEGLRDFAQTSHQYLGLALPLVLAFHWSLALRWAKKISK